MTALIIWIIIGFFVTKFLEWRHDVGHLKRGEEICDPWSLYVQLMSVALWPAPLTVYVRGFIKGRNER